MFRALLLLLPFLSLFPSVGADASLRIVWWNIEKGQTNRSLQHDPLRQNLMDLAGSPDSPDVLVLGEFDYEALSVETLTALRQNYVEAFLPYNQNSPDLGIAVFSKRDLVREVFTLKTLDWAPPGLVTEDEKQSYRRRWQQEDGEAYLYTRTYLRFRFTRGSETINVIPTHMLMPWLQIKDRYPGIIGSAMSGLSLLFGKSNPLVVQARQLRESLAADFGADLEGEPLVVLGDFNVPKRMAGIRTPGYRILSEGLRPAFARAQRTFPADEAKTFGRYPSLQLDHAFVNSSVEVQQANVLKLQGSDHYPISVTVQVNTAAACEPRLSASR